MNGHQIDELLKRKVDNARRGRTIRTVIAILVLVALIAIIAAAVHHHKTKAVSAPDVPSTVETDPAPADDETGEAESPAAGAKKPLQPEQMRRQQNKHVLVLDWPGVPEEEIPSIVTLTVVCQGEEVARFTLSEESEWRHSWSDDYPSEALSLRADLPKSIMASFVLRGDEFTVTGTYAGTAPAAPTNVVENGGEGEESEASDTSEGSEAPEASEGGEAPEASEDSEVPEASDGEQPEAQSGKIDAPAGDAPEETGDAPEEADDAETGESGEAPDAPKPGHNWWPIVLLMLCGAVLVALGLFGTDRRRTR